MNFISFFMACLIVSVIIRLFIIQVANADHYSNLASDQTYRSIEIKPDRGAIFDRNGRTLAQNSISYHIGARYKDIIEAEESLELLANIFGRTPEYYRNIFKDNDGFYYLEKDVSLDLASQLIDRQNGVKYKGRLKKELLGIKLDRIIRRHYPFDEAAGQLIGFTGDEQFGLSGVEKSCEDLLAGKSGRRRDMNDKYGRILLSSQNDMIPPQNGADINLSLDINYQIILEEEVRNAVENTEALSGMGMIMNPNTGQILAMASLPSFNPNNYRDHSIARQKIRPVTDTYEPGSIFKVVSIATALEEGIFTPQSKINCENGKWRIYDRTLHDTHANEWLSVNDILVQSSNIGTAKIAERLGNEKLYRSIKQFGIGEVKDLAITGTTTGMIKSPDQWGRITNSQISIGQSVTTTLLEIASMYSTIANGGRLLEPSIIHSFSTNNQNKQVFTKPKVIRRVLSPETSETMRYMLEKVVEEGTGKNAYMPGYRVAGKTGTAQKVIGGKYSQYDYYSTFVAFFPANQPVLLCAVAINDPRYGKHTASVAAAPAVKNIFSRIINSTDFRRLYDWVEEEPVISDSDLNNNINIKIQEDNKLHLSTDDVADEETPPELTKDTENENKGELIMPDLMGMTGKYAAYLLEEFSVEVEIYGGKGKVVAQKPKAGERLSAEKSCIIYVN